MMSFKRENEKTLVDELLKERIKRGTDNVFFFSDDECNNIYEDKM